MRKYLQKKFQLTDAGARGLEKSVWSSFAYYTIYMLPMMLMMFFVQSILESKGNRIETFVLGIGIITVLVYVVTNINYKTTYNETYKELPEDLQKVVISQ